MSPAVPQSFSEADLRRLRAPVAAFLGRVLRDADAAEDAASETLLVVLRKVRDGDAIGNLVSFALAVAWRIAQRRLAARSRDPAALEREPVAAGPDPARAAEIREWLVAALAQLSPQQRALLHLRFERDLSYAAIGRILGLGVPLVGWRLHRARADLAAALERTGDGRFAPLALALLPILSPEGAAAGAFGTAGTGKLTGAASVGLIASLTMKSAFWIATAAAVVLWLVLRALDGPPAESVGASSAAAASATAESPSAAGPAPDAAAAVAATPFAEPSTAATTRSAAARGRLVAVRVADLDDLPVAGATTTLRRSRDGAPVARAETDAAGRATFEQEAPYDPRVDGVAVFADGYVPRERPLVAAFVVREADGRERLEFDVVLSPATGVMGRVTDAATGAPVPHARVRLTTGFAAPEALVDGRLPDDLAGLLPLRAPLVAETATGADGRYALSGPAPAKDVRFSDVDAAALTVTAPGFAPAFLRYLPPETAGDVVRADAELWPATKLRGRVVDASGAPYAGAPVRVAFAARPAQNGSTPAIADPPGPGGAYRIATVAERVATTDADGAYRFADLGVPPGVVWRARVFDDRPERPLLDDDAAVSVECAAGGDVVAPDLTLVRARAYEVRLRVVDDCGAPLANAEARLGDAFGEFLARTAPVATDADGRTAVRPPLTWRPPEGRTAASEGMPQELAARVSAPGRATHVLRDVRPVPADSDAEPVVVALEPERFVAGVVVDRAGRPFPGAVVTASSAQAAPRTEGGSPARRPFGTATADSDGRFRLGGLRAEPFVVDFRGPVTGAKGGDLVAMFASRVLAGPQQGPFSASVPDLRLTLPGDSPLGVARLVVVVADERGRAHRDGGIATATGPDGVVRRAGVPASGRAVFDDLPEGRYAIDVDAKRRRPPPSAEIFVRSGERAELLVRTSPGVAARGTLAAADGTPVPPGAVVHARSACGRYERAADVDAAGNFTLEALGPGRWRAFAERWTAAEQDENRWRTPIASIDVVDGAPTAAVALVARRARAVILEVHGGAVRAKGGFVRIRDADGELWVDAAPGGIAVGGATIPAADDFATHAALPDGAYRAELVNADGLVVLERTVASPRALTFDAR